MSHADRTELRPRSVIIEEYYMEWYGKILRYWRFEGQSNWHVVTTRYKKLPTELYKDTADPKDFTDEKTS